MISQHGHSESRASMPDLNPKPRRSKKPYVTKLIQDDNLMSPAISGLRGERQLWGAIDRGYASMSPLAMAARHGLPSRCVLATPGSERTLPGRCTLATTGRDCTSQCLQHVPAAGLQLQREPLQPTDTLPLAGRPPPLVEDGVGGWTNFQPTGIETARPVNGTWGHTMEQAPVYHGAHAIPGSSCTRY